MLAFCYQGSVKKQWSYVVVAVLIYAVLFGMRYGVGRDHIAYWEMYKLGDFSLYEDEPALPFIIKLCKSLYFGPVIFFAIVSFVQLYLCFRVLRKDYYIYKYALIPFFLGAIWLSFSNGLRQEIAFCIFVSSLLAIKEKKWWAYYFMIIVAILFHKSAILLLPLYPILVIKDNWFKKSNLQLVTLLFVVTASNVNVIQDVFSHIDPFIQLIGYGDYFSEYRYSDFLYKESQYGIGYYLILATNIILVLYSDKYKGQFNSKTVNMMYSLYYIGVIMYYLFMGSLLLGRLNYYFYQFNFLVGAYALCYLNKANKYIYILLLLLYLLIFASTLYRGAENTAFFKFFWEVA